MARVLELPISGPIDREKATDAEFVGWNLAGAHPPLVLIRTWNDEIPRHQRLARALGPEQPLYSMGHPTGDESEPYPEHADQWADFCLSRLEKLGLEGPVRIGGWSFGGVIAFEVARRIATRGGEVALIAMLDTRLPKRKPNRDTRRLMKLGTTIQEYALITDREERRAYRRAVARHRLARTREKLRSLPRKLRRRRPPVRAGEVRLKGRMKPMDRLTRAIRVCYLKYEPEPTALPVVQLRTEDSRDRAEGDASLGWTPYLEGELRIVPVPGNHMNMFDEASVEVLARQLANALGR